MPADPQRPARYARRCSAVIHVSFSPDRCLPARDDIDSQTNIIPGQNGTYRHSQRRVTALIADSGQNPSARGCTTMRSVSRGRQSTKIYQIYKNSYPVCPERIAAEEQTLPVVAFDRLLRAHLRLDLRAGRMAIRPAASAYNRSICACKRKGATASSVPNQGCRPRLRCAMR